MITANPIVSAADNHNLANGDSSWFERKIDATGELISDVGEGLTKGLIGATVAGVNSILNTGIAVGNFLGADVEPINTYNTLTGLDDDLAKYYKEHKDGVELGGFMLGSIVPGTMGVKALSAAKAGLAGKNMLGSAGLMSTLTKDYATAASVEFAAGNSPFTLLNGNVLKGLAQGFGSSVLDAAAFQTAAVAAQYKSPTLEGQSFKDIFWDNVEGSILFGVIGGAFSGARLYTDISRTTSGVSKELFPYSFIPGFDEAATPTDKILTYYTSKFQMPEANLPENFGPIQGGIPAIPDADRLKLITQTRDKTLRRLGELTKEQLIKFSDGDSAISNQLFQQLESANKIEDIFYALHKSKGASRIGETETRAYGDVLFPAHGMSKEGFDELMRNGNTDLLFTPKAGKDAKGYTVTGQLSDLRILGGGKTAEREFGMGREAAFDAGYDIYRNSNGTFSINPDSKILKLAENYRAPNNIIVDFEQNGAIVPKAIPGLADLTSKTRGIEVRGDTVLAGDLPAIKMRGTTDFDPVKEFATSAQARYIWAQQTKNIFKEGMIIGENDLPLLEKAYNDLEMKTLRIKRTDGKIEAMPKGENLRNFIESQKKKLAEGMKGMPLEEMELRLNVDRNWLTGEPNGKWQKMVPGDDWAKPRYAKIDMAEDINTLPMLNPINQNAQLAVQRQIEGYREIVKQTFSNFAKDYADRFPDAPNLSNPNRIPTTEGAGPGFLSFANSNYGSYGAWAQYTGSQTTALKILRQTIVKEKLSPAFANLVRSGENNVAEAALVNNRLRASGDAWIQHPVDAMSMIPRRLLKQVAEGGYHPTKDEMITFKSAEAKNVFDIHRDINAENQTHTANLKGTAGVADDFDPGVYYPIPIDTANLKHFVFVEPRAPVSLGDKKRVIFAKDQATLEKMISTIDQEQFKVSTKQDKENFHRAEGDYQHSLGMNESSVDSELRRKGILSQMFPATDDSFLTDLEKWHMRQQELLTHKMVYARYQPDFESLRLLGERYTNLATSQVRGLTEALERSAKNPYNDYVKTALGISRASEYPWWQTFNQFVQRTIETPINKLRDIFTENKKIDDSFVEHVNNILDDMGQGRPFERAMQAMIANRNIPDRPWLQPLVAKAQAVMSTSLLQWDTLNAVNNIVGSAVLDSAEYKHITQAILKSNTEAVGDLGRLMSVGIPDGSNNKLPTIKRMFLNAQNDFTGSSETKDALMKRFRDIGAVADLGLQMKRALEDLTLDWKNVTRSQAESGFEKFTDKMRSITGNQLAENYNRFMAAHVMKQITDIGIKAGVIGSESEANEFIQLAVNRTQGNYLYSQRPIVFQGVVGQAISLFQTYQFNLMQQLFRYVGEGDTKSLSMLMGMQGSIYGLNGLPAFQFLNTHIVGNAAGNTNHRDLYNASYTVLGKSLGDWMLYGLGSNALGLVDPSLRVNLFSRGDINPRQLTVLPTSIDEIPMVSASVKFASNIFKAFDKVSNGAVILPSVLQAIEHNGLSRPLAGIAQIAQGYTTSAQGSLLTASQDFWSATTATRLLGGKPFDEAVALDSLYRMNAYKAKDALQIEELGSAVKTALVGGQNPSPEQMNTFMANYMKAGGRIEGFNRFMTNAMLTSNRSQVNAVAQHLKSPFAQQMQVIMGGTPVPDFMNAPQTN